MNNDEFNQYNQQNVNDVIKPMESEPVISQPVEPIQPASISTPEPAPVVEKPKSNKGSMIIIVILVLLLLGSCGYIVWDKFFNKKSEPEPIVEVEPIPEEPYYSGFYKGCVEIEGAEECAELVVTEDRTAFLTINPLAPTAIVGSYTSEDDTLTINGIYFIAGQNPGIKYATYNLEVTEDGFIYNYKPSDETIKFELTETTEDQLTTYSGMKSTE